MYYNKLKGQNKTQFEALFEKKKVKYKGEEIEIYCSRNPIDTNANQKIYDILEQIGYNNLSIYDFLKHMSDKRGAHIDVELSLVISKLVNQAIEPGLTPICCIAAQMIYAAKKQIPELANYWPEISEIDYATVQK